MWDIDVLLRTYQGGEPDTYQMLELCEKYGFVWYAGCRAFEYSAGLNMLRTREPPKGSTVLDVGGGRSPLPAKLMQLGFVACAQDIRHSGGPVQDPTKQNITDFVNEDYGAAVRFFMDTGKWIHYEIKPVDQVAAKFDVVVSVSALEHFSDNREKMVHDLNAMFDCAKPGAPILLTTDIIDKHRGFCAGNLGVEGQGWWLYGRDDLQELIIQNPKVNLRSFTDKAQQGQLFNDWWQRNVMTGSTEWAAPPSARHSVIFMTLERTDA
jgi:hypothetical protein